MVMKNGTQNISVTLLLQTFGEGLVLIRQKIYSQISDPLNINLEHRSVLLKGASRLSV